MQPVDQKFQTADGRPGGLLSLGAARQISRHVEVWTELQAKSEGWAPTVPELRPGLSGAAGINLFLP
ncbi:MAG: hypothetical protein HYZ28_05995 [Myxococcales bacterium]|nr:hypothetical protein [Myxococcales bacterium]